MSVYNILVAVKTEIANAKLRQLQGNLKATATQAKGVTSVFQKFGHAFTAVALIYELKQLSDEFLKIKNNLAIAGLGGDKLSASFDRLYQISQKTRTPLEGNSDLMRQLALSSRDTGATMDEMFKITENAATGLALLGVTGQRATAATIQLAHGLSEGVVKARQWNSLLIDNPALLHAMAEATNQTLSQIRQMIITQQYTSRAFKDDLLKTGEVLEKWWGRAVPTISQAFTVFNNSLVRATGSLEQNAGLLSGFAYALIAIGHAAEYVLPALINFGLAFGVAQLVVWIQGLGGATMALRLFATAFTFVTGPLNRWLFLLGAIGTALSIFGGYELKIAGHTVTLSQVIRNIISTFIDWAGSLRNLSMLVAALGVAWLVLTQRINLGLGAIGAIITVTQMLGFSMGETTLVVNAFIAVWAAWNYELLIAAFWRVIGVFTTLKTLLMVQMIPAIRAFGVALFTLNFNPLILEIGAITVGLTAFVAIVIMATGYWDDFVSKTKELAADGMEALSNGLSAAQESLIDIVTSTDKWANSADETGHSIEEAGDALDKIKDKMKAVSEEGGNIKKWFDEIGELDWMKDNGGGGGGGQVGQGLSAIDQAMQNAGLDINAGNRKIVEAMARGGTSFADAARSYAKTLQELEAQQKKAEAKYNASVEASQQNSPGTYTSTFAPYWSADKLPGGGYELGRTPAFGGRSSSTGVKSGFQAVQDAPGSMAATAAANAALIAQLNKAWGEMKALMIQNIEIGRDGVTLSQEQVKLLVAKNPGMDYKDIRQMQEYNREELRQQKKLYDMEKAYNDKFAKAQEKANLIAQQKAEAQAKKDAAQQSYNQSLEQTLLQAMNSLGVSSVSGLPQEVQQLAKQIANYQKTLQGQTDPTQRANTSRTIQLLQDQLTKLTGIEQNTASTENPYLAYAQNVYEKLSKDAATRLTEATDMYVKLGGVYSAVAKSSSTTSSSTPVKSTATSQTISAASHTGITGLTGGFSGSPLFLAKGGDFEVPGTGEYPFAAFLHGGEKVSVTPKGENSGKTTVVQVTMNVNGVEDVDGFKRSETQILSSLNRRLATVGRLG